MATPDTTSTLDARAEQALSDGFLRGAVRYTVERLRNAKALGTERFGSWEEWRERGRGIRSHTIANLDFYLDRFRAAVEAAGGHVHFAADADEARRLAESLLLEREAKMVAKSKSMVTEEVHLNDRLEELGIEPVETDLGEWIVQLAHETPSHIILPAIHKSRGQIRTLFEDHGGAPLAEDTKTLAGYARRKLRERFLAADVGISGCNFAVAETGSVCLFTNEGNGRMVTTLPRTHLVFMGMERIVPTWEDLETMVQLLPRSATGQKITTYLNIVTGPRREGEADGPEELHVIVLDNGRSRQLGDDDFQELLNCIRCGACLNVCPVYRQIGGHAYGSVYPGPIGAVLTPRLENERDGARELAGASSLCGACTDACPVKIPLHDMLVRQRRRNTRGGSGNLAEKLVFRAFGVVARRANAYSFFAAQARRFGRIAARYPRLAKPLAGWLRSRELPSPPARSFRERWSELEREASS